MNVYVIASEGGMVKIGKANDPAKRVRELATGHPFELSVAHVFAMRSDSEAHRVERLVHEMLASYRMKGEWFGITPEAAADAIGSVEYLGPAPPTVPCFVINGLVAIAGDLVSEANELLAAAKARGETPANTGGR